MADEKTLNLVLLPLCDACLDGAGDECHTPGCALFLNRAPDLALRASPAVIAFKGEAGMFRLLWNSASALFAEFLQERGGRLPLGGNGKEF